MKKFLIILAALSALFCSCNKEAVTPEPEMVNVTFDLTGVSTVFVDGIKVTTNNIAISKGIHSIFWHVLEGFDRTSSGFSILGEAVILSKDSDDCGGEVDITGNCTINVFVKEAVIPIYFRYMSITTDGYSSSILTKVNPGELLSTFSLYDSYGNRVNLDFSPCTLGMPTNDMFAHWYLDDCSAFCNVPSSLYSTEFEYYVGYLPYGKYTIVLGNSKSYDAMFCTWSDTLSETVLKATIYSNNIQGLGGSCTICNEKTNVFSTDALKNGVITVDRIRVNFSY